MIILAAPPSADRLSTSHRARAPADRHGLARDIAAGSIGNVWRTRRRWRQDCQRVRYL